MHRIGLKSKLYQRGFSVWIALVFGLQTVLPSLGHAQNSIVPATAPLPTFFQDGSYVPPLLKGMTLSSNNPFELEFIIDSGDADLTGEALQAESLKLVKYFLAALTTPESEMWVNLNPAEPDRIVPARFGRTGMGRDLLAQDYMLKQLTAAALSPENSVGAKFWQAVHDQFGKEATLNLARKIWIVPDRSEIMTRGQQVFVVASRLKVMLEQDYVHQRQEGVTALSGAKDGTVGTDAELTALARARLLPAIEYEVNHSRAFAPLRQVFHSLILAVWYKEQLRRAIVAEQNVSGENLTAEVSSRSLTRFVDQQKIGGLTVEEDAAARIYQQYLQVFHQGVSSFIHEVYDPQAQQLLTQKYITGGVTTAGTQQSLVDVAMSARDEMAFSGTPYRLKIGLGSDSSRNATASRDLPDHFFQEIRRLVDLNPGRPAVLFSDKDDTLAVMHQAVSVETIEAILDFVQAGNVFVLTTGGSEDRTRREFINILSAQAASRPEYERKKFRIFVQLDNGGRTLVYDAARNDFILFDEVKLEDTISPEILTLVENDLSDLLARRGRELDAFVQPQLRLERLASELRVVFLNGQSDADFRRQFDTDHGIREGWADDISDILDQHGLREMMEANVTGSSTINITLKDLNKYSGAQRLLRLVPDLSGMTKFFTGNEPTGNDRHFFDADSSEVALKINFGNRVQPEGGIVNVDFAGGTGAIRVIRAIAQTFRQGAGDAAMSGGRTAEQLEPFRRRVQRLLNLTSGRLIAVFDKDDTLVWRRQRISPEMIEMVKTLLDNNGVFILSTGDSEDEVLKNIAGPLQEVLSPDQLENIYFQTDNGARVIKYSAYSNTFEVEYQANFREVITDQEITNLQSAIADVIAEKQAELINREGYGDSGAQVKTMHLDAEFRIMLLGDITDADYRNRFDPAPYPIRSQWLSSIRQKIADLGLADRIEVRISGTGTLNVTRQGIDKGYGLEWIERNMPNFSREAVVAIGDKLGRQENDRPLIENGRAALAVNVGDAVLEADVPEGVTVFHSALKGPDGAALFLREIVTALTEFHHPDLSLSSPSEDGAMISEAGYFQNSALDSVARSAVFHRNPRAISDYDLPEEIFGVRGVNLIDVFNDAWKDFVARHQDLILPEVAVLEMLGSAVYSLEWAVMDDIDVTLMFDLVSDRMLRLLESEFYGYLSESFNRRGITTSVYMDEDGSGVRIEANEGTQFWAISARWSQDASRHVLDRLRDSDIYLSNSAHFIYLFDRNYYQLGLSSPVDWTFADMAEEFSVPRLYRMIQLRLNDQLQSGLEFLFGEDELIDGEGTKDIFYRMKVLKRFASVANLIGDSDRSQRLLEVYARLASENDKNSDVVQEYLDFELVDMVNRSFIEELRGSFWGKGEKLRAYQQALQEQGREVPWVVEDMLALLEISERDIYQRIADVYELNLSGDQLMELADQEGEALTLGWLKGNFSGDDDARPSQTPGGIDLNPRLWTLEQSGSDAPTLSLPLTPVFETIDWETTDGLYPFIIQISPISASQRVLDPDFSSNLSPVNFSAS